MKLNILLRLAVSALTLAALSPLARADEKGDAVLKRAELRARTFKTYAATLVVDDPANHKIPALLQVWIKKAPLYFRLTSPDPDDNRWFLQNQSGFFTGTPASLEKQPKPLTEFPGNFPFVTGDYAGFVGGITETKWISEEISGADRHAVDVVEVVGKKNSVTLTVTREGAIEKWERRRPDGSREAISVVKVETDRPISLSVFDRPAVPRGIPSATKRAE